MTKICTAASLVALMAMPAFAQDSTAPSPASPSAPVENVAPVPTPSAVPAPVVTPDAVSVEAFRNLRTRFEHVMLTPVHNEFLGTAQHRDKYLVAGTGAVLVKPEPAMIVPSQLASK